MEQHVGVWIGEVKSNENVIQLNQEIRSRAFLPVNKNTVKMTPTRCRFPLTLLPWRQPSSVNNPEKPSWAHSRIERRVAALPHSSLPRWGGPTSGLPGHIPRYPAVQPRDQSARFRGS